MQQPTGDRSPVTAEENHTVIETLHQMELRMTERMTRVETELREWRKESDRLRDADRENAHEIAALRAEFESERQYTQGRFGRVILLLAAVTLIGLGDLSVRALPLL